MFVLIFANLFIYPTKPYPSAESGLNRYDFVDSLSPNIINFLDGFIEKNQRVAIGFSILITLPVRLVLKLIARTENIPTHRGPRYRIAKISTSSHFHPIMGQTNIIYFLNKHETLNLKPET